MSKIQMQFIFSRKSRSGQGWQGETSRYLGGLGWGVDNKGCGCRKNGIMEQFKQK